MLKSQRVAQSEEEDQKNMKIETFDLRRANEDTFDPRRTQAAAANDSVNFGRHDSPERQQDQ